MAAVELDGVTLGRVRRVSAPAGFETLASANGIPVIGRWREGAATAIYVGIGATSEWPLSPSFPIFWMNVVAASIGLGREPGGFGCVRPGELCQVAAAEGGAKLVGPGGLRRDLAAGAFRPERVGVYRLAAGEREHTIAASLLTEGETMAPASVASLPPDLLRPSQEEAGAAIAWRASGGLALAGLALLVVHGWLASRRRGI
jgi:hypothetical protein